MLTLPMQSDSNYILYQPPPDRNSVEEAKENALRSKRRSRTKFTKEQLDILEATFNKTHYPDVTVVDKLSSLMKLGTERISIWFQNRRARYKKTKKCEPIGRNNRNLLEDDDNEEDNENESERCSSRASYCSSSLSSEVRLPTISINMYQQQQQQQQPVSQMASLIIDHPADTLEGFDNNKDESYNNDENSNAAVPQQTNYPALQSNIFYPHMYTQPVEQQQFQYLFKQHQDYSNSQNMYYATASVPHIPIQESQNNLEQDSKITNILTETLENDVDNNEIIHAAVLPHQTNYPITDSQQALQSNIFYPHMYTQPVEQQQQQQFQYLFKQHQDYSNSQNMYYAAAAAAYMSSCQSQQEQQEQQQFNNMYHQPQDYHNQQNSNSNQENDNDEEEEGEEEEEDKESN